MPWMRKRRAGSGRCRWLAAVGLWALFSGSADGQGTALPPALLAPGLAVAPSTRADTRPAVRVEAAAPSPAGTSIEPRAAPTLGKRILWYVPNRVMDLLDVFRLRLRLGPGLAANFRITDYGAFYVGKYDSVYAGLPGPRHPYVLRPYAGFESLDGLLLAGVDATDDTPHGPIYGVAEMDLGVQVLLVGAEAGFDFVELADFLGGWVGFDPMDDDFPGVEKVPPETSSGITYVAEDGVFKVDPKPAEFSDFPARLDYMNVNAQRRISEPVRFTDAYFADDRAAPIDVPETQFRLGMYVAVRQGDDFELELKPDFEIDVELPNIEHRLRVFVESAQNNALPQSSAIDNEESGVDIGARKYLDDLDISIDAGVRATWVPEAFVRATWRGDWRVGEWNLEPEQRIFYETEDKFGFRSGISSTRWFGPEQPYVVIPDASLKFTTDKDEFDWAFSLKGMRVQRLLDERRRGRGLDWDDTAVAQGLLGSVFGTDGEVDKYRLAVGFRFPVYKRWIYLEVDPGLEWEEEDDYGTTAVLQVGLDLLFWGQAYR